MENNVVLLNPFKSSKIPLNTIHITTTKNTCKKKSDYDVILPQILKMIHTLSDKIDTIDTKIDNFVREYSQNKKTSNLHQRQSSTVPQKMYPDYCPSIDYDNWINEICIQREHVNVVFRCTILEGFKQFIQTFISSGNKTKNSLPIVAFGAKHKTLYIYQLLQNNEDDHLSTDTSALEKGEWIPINEKIIHILIESVWRKMLEFYYLSEPEPNTDETVRDINKKKLIDMRKGLVEKHTKEIERFLTKIVSTSTV
jgi:hypothetical protein